MSTFTMPLTERR